MQFALISMVVLPVLPDRAYGPYGVFNPFEIWLMVVLIVGISLVGYVAYKLLGAKDGAVLGGVLGGVISSTATTVSSARRAATTRRRRTRRISDHDRLGAMVRVMIEIAFVASGSFLRLALPLGAMLGSMALIAAGAYLFTRKEPAELGEQKNPAYLDAALLFALIYAIIKLAVAAAKEHFGAAGLYLVGVISGLTDMDAITLSTSQLVNQGRLETQTAWRLILVASLANLVFKAGIVAVIGGRALLKYVVAAFGAAFASRR